MSANRSLSIPSVISGNGQNAAGIAIERRRVTIQDLQSFIA